MRKGIPAGQWLPVLSAGKVCLRGEEGCKWHEKLSLPSHCHPFETFDSLGGGSGRQKARESGGQK